MSEAFYLMDVVRRGADSRGGGGLILQASPHGGGKAGAKKGPGTFFLPLIMARNSFKKPDGDPGVAQNLRYGFKYPKGRLLPDQTGGLSK
jgi:hypothetical protein